MALAHHRASTMRPAQEESTDIEEIEDASGNLEYISLKAMADADHKVSVALISEHSPPSLTCVFLR